MRFVLQVDVRYQHWNENKAVTRNVCELLAKATTGCLFL